ncbi:MAG TPA: hypothetical protein VNU92_16245 [Edaphobacter sp.]|jgi:hypothetical protein|nr:hypothetical protein [Edaphobacter sp.]
MNKRLLILGLGDLGAQIARIVTENGFASNCLLAGNSSAAKQWAQLLRIVTASDVEGRQVDALDVEEVKRLLGDYEPDLIIQCASLLSPFALAKSDSPAAKSVLQGGFALQVSAQLPAIRNVMLARRSLGLTCPVVNCSYPDLTHPMLAAEGLSPTCGVGNVAILAMRFQRLVPGADSARLRVISHHAHLIRSLLGDGPSPLVFLGDRQLPEGQLLLKTGLQSGSTLNYLAAATILPILTGLLRREVMVKAHAPGVDGLPGGYPVVFEDGEIRIDLPSGVSLARAVKFNTESAALEGIERVNESGTLFYTKYAQDAVAQWCPDLAEPLALSDVSKRFEILKSVLR